MGVGAPADALAVGAQRDERAARGDDAGAREAVVLLAGAAAAVVRVPPASRGSVTPQRCEGVAVRDDAGDAGEVFSRATAAPRRIPPAEVRAIGLRRCVLRKFTTSVEFGQLVPGKREGKGKTACSCLYRSRICEWEISRPGRSVCGERANFTGLVLGCINTKC